MTFMYKQQSSFIITFYRLVTLVSFITVFHSLFEAVHLNPETFYNLVLKLVFLYKGQYSHISYCYSSDNDDKLCILIHNISYPISFLLLCTFFISIHFSPQPYLISFTSFSILLSFMHFGFSKYKLTFQAVCFFTFLCPFLKNPLFHF